MLRVFNNKSHRLKVSIFLSHAGNQLVEDIHKLLTKKMLTIGVKFYATLTSKKRWLTKKPV